MEYNYFGKQNTVAGTCFQVFLRGVLLSIPAKVMKFLHRVSCDCSGLLKIVSCVPILLLSWNHNLFLSPEWSKTVSLQNRPGSLSELTILCNWKEIIPFLLPLVEVIPNHPLQISIPVLVSE